MQIYGQNLSLFEPNIQLVDPLMADTSSTFTILYTFGGTVG